MLSRSWRRCCGAALLALAATVATRAAERTFAITDYTGRGFAPDVVTYRVDGAKAKKLRVFDAAGRSLACQTRELRKGELELSFITDLPAGATREFVLRDDGRGEVPATAVSARKDDGALVLANGIFAVKVPAAQTKTFKEPVAAKALPAPVLAFRGAAETAWRGSSTILATRPVQALKVTLVTAGPVFCEVRYELEFATGGYYRATVRVEDRVPLATISEEYDPGVMDGTDAWELDLAKGWAPDRMEVARTNGNGGVDNGRVDTLDKLKEKPSWYLVPDSAWGAPLSQLGLFAESAQKANPARYPMAGVIPLHKGDWRHMNALEIQSTGPADVRVRFPMSRRYASWLREVTSETSPFSMQEHEPGLPQSYSRRHWGLVLAPPAATTKAEGRDCGPFYQARLFYGVLGLDRYKDFILGWQDGGVKYPQLYLKPDEVERYRRDLQGAALPAEFKQKLQAATIVLGADEKAVQKRLKHLQSALQSITVNVLTSPTTGHHWTAPLYMTAAEADDVLAWPELPAAARTDIRTRIALILHLWEDADIVSYANGSHPGNPNMGTARFSPLVAFLPLLPDHPFFAKWRAHMSQYLEYKASQQTAPGGGYFEYGAAYHMHGFARVTNAIPALAAAGADNVSRLVAIAQPNWDYYMNLLTPVDSRWGTRLIPGLANSPPGNTEHFLEAAGLFARREAAGLLAAREPAFAASLFGAWQANGANYGGDPSFGVNGILAPVGVAPVEPKLASCIYPGVGVIFRAHQGPEETYMLFRSGFNWSHWYIDQGHFILMSRGATLVPFQPYQYWWSPNKEFDMYNTMRFGHPANEPPHGWPDSNILDCAFGDSVDYAWSLNGIPDWFIQPGATPDFGGKVDAPVGSGGARKLADGFTQKQGALEWNRQILFLKGKTARSPNYFVIRDTVHGDGRLASYLYLNLLGKKSGVKQDGGRFLVDSEWPVKLDVRFVQPQALQPEFYEERQPLSFYGANIDSRREQFKLSPNWGQKDGSPFKDLPKSWRGSDSWEQHTILRLPGQPGAGYSWLLYPRAVDEPEPTVTALAEGVLKIETPEGTDYAMLSPVPLTFVGEKVTFEGCAGTVRVARDGGVTLALAGGRGRVGYQGRTLAGTGPFEKRFAPGELKAGEDTMPVGATAFDVGQVVAADLPLLAPGVRLSAAVGTLVCHVDAAVAGGRVTGSFDGRILVEAQGRAYILADAASTRFVVPDVAYAKLAVGNVGVRGVGPFDLTFTPAGVKGSVGGRTRSLVCTWPEKIVRPMFALDGQRWYAGWADDHSIAKGTTTPQFAIAFGTTEGTHTVEIREWEYPALPSVPPRRALTD